MTAPERGLRVWEVAPGLEGVGGHTADTPRAGPGAGDGHPSPAPTTPRSTNSLQWGDSATGGRQCHSHRVPRSLDAYMAFPRGSRGLGDAVGTPSPKGAQPKAEPTLLGTPRAPGTPFPALPMPAGPQPRDLWSPACSSLTFTPFSQDMLRINLTPTLCVGTVIYFFFLPKNLELMGKSQNCFFFFSSFKTPLEADFIN